MSITLDYQSVDPVPEPTAALMIRHAVQLVDEHDWWAEPISLDLRQRDRRLQGSTRIRLGGYGLVEVPRDEEALMVCRDTRFVVSSLARWSSKYGISWTLSEIGTDIGSIVGGKPDEKLARYIAGLCTNLKLPASAEADVLKKHEARKY
ncbi:hypothetical protein [Roseateles sp.]|uniref:hypothetical protein n=1 Tax=Roseateles sp. TaxID=1971397 RepID=UPI0031E08282